MSGIEKVIQRINNIETRFHGKPPAKQEEPFAGVLQRTQKAVSPESQDTNKVAGLVKQYAVKYGVDPQLALAVADAESSFDTTATSQAGAAGVMQLMPDTARSLGVKNLYDPNENIDGGVRYLKQMLSTFNGDVSKALAAYNAGPEAVKTYGGIPPYRETQDYVAKILAASKG